MKEQLITFETAKLAKEKGLCNYFMKINPTKYVSAFYSEDGVNYEETEFHQEDCIIEDRYFRPTQSLLQKWLREKHNIFIQIDVNFNVKIYYKDELYDELFIFNSYEQALEKALQKALKLIN